MSQSVYRCISFFIFRTSCTDREIFVIAWSAYHTRPIERDKLEPIPISTYEPTFGTLVGVTWDSIPPDPYGDGIPGSTIRYK